MKKKYLYFELQNSILFDFRTIDYFANNIENIEYFFFEQGLFLENIDFETIRQQPRSNSWIGGFCRTRVLEFSNSIFMKTGHRMKKIVSHFKKRLFLREKEIEKSSFHLFSISNNYFFRFIEIINKNRKWKRLAAHTIIKI